MTSYTPGSLSTLLKSSAVALPESTIVPVNHIEGDEQQELDDLLVQKLKDPNWMEFLAAELIESDDDGHSDNSSDDNISDCEDDDSKLCESASEIDVSKLEKKKKARELLREALKKIEDANVDFVESDEAEASNQLEDEDDVVNELSANKRNDVDKKSVSSVQTVVESDVIPKKRRRGARGSKGGAKKKARKQAAIEIAKAAEESKKLRKLEQKERVKKYKALRMAQEETEKSGAKRQSKKPQNKKKTTRAIAPTMASDRTLFVSNLPFDIDDKTLRNAFPGNVTSIHIECNNNGRPAGFAYVEFESESLRASVFGNAPEISGRTLRLSNFDPASSYRKDGKRKRKKKAKHNQNTVKKSRDFRAGSRKFGRGTR